MDISSSVSEGFHTVSPQSCSTSSWRCPHPNGILSPRSSLVATNDLSQQMQAHWLKSSFRMFSVRGDESWQSFSFASASCRHQLLCCKLFSEMQLITIHAAGAYLRLVFLLAGSCLAQEHTESFYVSKPR